MTAPYSSSRYAYEGTETTETSVVRPGGATDPAGQPQSRKIMTTANAQWLRPFRCEPWAIWNETTGADVTVTVYGMTSSLSMLTNCDIWLEIEYPNTTHGTIVTTTRSNVLAACTPLASDSSTWPALQTTWDLGTAALVTLSGGDLVATNTGGGTLEQGVRTLGGTERASGKYYYEITFTAYGGGFASTVGVGTLTSTYTGMGTGITGTVFRPSSGNVLSEGVNIASIGTGWGVGNIIGVAVDLDNRNMWFRLSPSGVWNNSALSNPVTNVDGRLLPASVALMPFHTFNAANNVWTANFGGSPFVGAVPSGFTSGWASATLVPFKLVATLNSPQPGRPGLIHVRPKIGKASATVYLDPKIELTPASAAPSSTHKSSRYAYEGTETTETSIVRSGGTAHSRKIVTTANSQWLRPYRAEPYAVWNDTVGADVTVMVYGLALGALPTNCDAFLEVEYLGDASSTLGKIVTTTRANVLATCVDVASDGSTWSTGAGGDLYWSSVKLLMRFNDVDGATGAPGMLDESSAAHGTGTANLQAQIDTAQFKFGASSLLLDGSSDRVSFLNHADYNLSNSPFTIECWIRPTTITGTHFILARWESAGTLGWVFSQSNAEIGLNVSTTGSDNISVASGGALTANAWHAVCVDFDGAKYRIYINGAMVASSTTPLTIHSPVQLLAIGSSSTSGGFGFAGWIDELRLTNGVARYASDSGYTVATSEFPSGQAFTPFKLVATLDGVTIPAIPASDPYWSNVKLLMGYDDADGAQGAPGMLDESPVYRGLAAVVNTAQVDTAQSALGGSSLLTNGSNAYLWYPNSPDWHLSNQPFTIELRFRAASLPTTSMLLSRWGTDGALGWSLICNTTTVNLVFSTTGSNASNQTMASAPIVINTWYALAVDFDGTKYRMYINGAMVGSSTTLYTPFDNGGPLYIGANNNVTFTYVWNGWIDELRFTKGVARYASDAGYTVDTTKFPRGTAAIPPAAPRPGQPGLINVRIKAAKPSSTFYIDPTPILAPASSLGGGSGGGEPTPPDPDVYDPATGDEAPVMQIAVDVDSLAASFAADAISAHGDNPAGTTFTSTNWTSPSASLKYATATDTELFLFAGTYFSRDQSLAGWTKNGEVFLRLVDGKAWVFQINHEGAGSLTLLLCEGLSEGSTSPINNSATETYNAGGTSTLNADIVAKIPGFDTNDTEGHKQKFETVGLDFIFSYSLDGSSFTEIRRWTSIETATWLHVAPGAVAIANITGYGWRDFLIDYNDNPSHLYSDFTETLDVRDFGVKDVQTTGSMTSGSPTLIVADATGLEIGDFIVVDTYGASGAGVPGGRGPGGQWPSLRYPNQTAMAADLTKPVDTACSLEDTGYVWHFDGAAWQRDATWNPDYSYMHKSHPMALRAKIIAKSGTILTLNQNAQITVGGSRVYHDNAPLLTFLADTQDFHVEVPEVEILFPNSRVVMGAALNIYGHPGWSLRGAGSGRANSTPTGRTRFFGPLGCPGVEVNFTNYCVSVKDIHIDSGGYLDLPQINAQAMAQTEYQVNWPHALMFSLCNDIVVDNVNVTQVFQQAVGFRYCHTATVSNCTLRMVDPLAHYIQWMYQTANSTNIRYIDCEMDADWMTTFCEPFADDGAEFIRCIARNGISSNNTAVNTKYTDCGTILEALSRYSYNSQHVQNPVLQSNSNIGPGSPSTMTVDRFRYLLEDYVDVAKEQPKGIVLSASAGSTVSNSNLEMLPYDLASSLNGAQGIICDSGDCTISAVRVDGTTVGDWAGNITAYDATASGTDIVNCIADRQNNSQTGGTLTGAQTVAAAGTDRAPASVSFTPVVGATIGQTYTSNEITISGVNALLRNVTLTSNAKLIWLGDGVVPQVGNGTIRDHDHWVRKILRDGDKLKLQAVAAAGTVTVTLQLATGQSYNWTITA